MRYTLINSTLKRCFHTNPVASAKVKEVALSKFEPDQFIQYDKYTSTLSTVRKRLNRPLTLSEKILYSHLNEPETQVSSVLCLNTCPCMNDDLVWPICRKSTYSAAISLKALFQSFNELNKT